MAKALNKSRMRDTKLVAIIVLATYFITGSLFPEETPLHEINEFIGYFLVIICAFGRIYTTAFIGGFKNDELVTDGPFSLVRNPLYVFSLIGILGIGFQSNHLSVIIMAPLLVLIMYHFLIRREEGFLEEKFGQTYRDYKARVPRLMPRLRGMTMPEEIRVRPKFLWRSLLDAFAWFLAFPTFELLDYLKEIGWLPTLFTLY